MKYNLKYKNKITNLKDLLIARGIEDVDRYLTPTKKELLDFNCLDNIDSGIKMLSETLNKEDSKIFLVVDSDCDGFTSAAIMYLYIKKIKPNQEIKYFVHNGKQHGLEDVVESIEDFDLVILPDSSSNDYEYHSILKGKGIKTLVLDHHEADKYSEDAVVINNQLSQKYSNKSLSGAGVVYRFCQSLDSFYQVQYSSEFIDLSAVGIIGDLMDLRPLENRYIIKTGLNKIVNPLLRAIVEKQAFSIGDINNITPIGIAFYVVPLINALIRVGTPQEKEILFEAFIDGDREVDSTKRGAKGTKESLSEQATRNCVNARSRQNRLKEKYLDIIDIQIEKNDWNNRKILSVIIEDEDMDTNLTGLLAMNLVTKYQKPVLVMRKADEGCLKGSMRNNGASEMKDFKLFINNSKIFEFAEGHGNACGVSIKENNLNKFLDYADKELAEVDFKEGAYEVDFITKATDELLPNLILEIGNNKTIWGQGNDEPYIIIENIALSGSEISLIGATKDTLKFVKNGVTYIKFKATDMIEDLKNRQIFSLTILGRGNLNNWMGTVSPQIFIEDYNIHNSLLDF